MIAGLICLMSTTINHTAWQCLAKVCIFDKVTVSLILYVLTVILCWAGQGRQEPTLKLLNLMLCQNEQWSESHHVFPLTHHRPARFELNQVVQEFLACYNII